MKLARPAVFHPRIVLAGCPAAPGGGEDDAGLVAALRRRGLHARWLSWDDPQTLDADLVVLRATWDYLDRLDDFLAWTRQVRRLLNGPEVVAWNTDERYLAQLAAAGVPTVSGRARDRTHPAETTLVFVEGRPSHAVDAGTASLVEPDFELWDTGGAALGAAAGIVGVAVAELLYARVELVGGPAAPLVRALDLVTPSLTWLPLDPATRALRQRDFALAMQSALERFGLGPLSHRGP